MYETFKNYVNRTDNGEINPNLCKFSSDAKIEWKRIFNEITDFQNDENENEYLKSMYPKQKSYIPRFSLLIHCIDSFFDDSINILEVSKDSILKAEKLSKYFISVAKKVKYESNEFNELKTTSKKAESTFDKIKLIYQNDKDFNKSKVAELLGVSRITIIRTIKKIEENEA